MFEAARIEDYGLKASLFTESSGSLWPQAILEFLSPYYLDGQNLFPPDTPSVYVKASQLITHPAADNLSILLVRKKKPIERDLLYDYFHLAIFEEYPGLIPEHILTTNIFNVNIWISADGICRIDRDIDEELPTEFSEKILISILAITIKLNELFRTRNTI